MSIGILFAVYLPLQDVSVYKIIRLHAFTTQSTFPFNAVC